MASNQQAASCYQLKLSGAESQGFKVISSPRGGVERGFERHQRAVVWWRPGLQLEVECKSLGWRRQAGGAWS